MIQTVTPIDEHRRREVMSATQGCVQRVRALTGYTLPMLAVNFDLTGRAAGMYRVRDGQPEIRYNPYLFAKYFADNMATTVPHEVAHYAVDRIHGGRKVRPHGPEWRALMRDLGVEPLVTTRFDLAGIPVRRQRRHAYSCACRRHELTTRRHNLIRRQARRYFCRVCRDELAYLG